MTRDNRELNGGRLLEMPAARHGEVVHVDRPSSFVLRILAHRVQKAYAAFESPLEMLTAQESNTGLQTEVVTLELLLAVERIARIRIDIVCVGRGHDRERGAEADDHPGSFGFEMIPCRHEYVGEAHPVRVIAHRHEVVDLAELCAKADSRHHRPLVVESDIEAIG